MSLNLVKSRIQKYIFVAFVHQHCKTWSKLKMSAYKPQNDYSIFVFTLKKKKVFVYHGFYLLRLVTGLVINPVSQYLKSCKQAFASELSI